MDQIRISDVTMKQSGKDFSLSFKEKIEIPKLLDKLGVSVIELEPVVQAKIDALRIKSVASTVKNSVVAVPVQLTQESVDMTWNALKEAKHPRLQVCASISTVQMEYLFKKKPEAMLKAIEALKKPAENARRVKIEGGQCWIRSAPNVTGETLGLAKRDSGHEYAGETAANGGLKIDKGWGSGKYGKLVDGERRTENERN